LGITAKISIAQHPILENTGQYHPIPQCQYSSNPILFHPMKTVSLS